MKESEEKRISGKRIFCRENILLAVGWGWIVLFERCTLHVIVIHLLCYLMKWSFLCFELFGKGDSTTLGVINVDIGIKFSDTLFT